MNLELCTLNFEVVLGLGSVAFEKQERGKLKVFQRPKTKDQIPKTITAGESWNHY
jgi:hypothetical protein